MAVKCMVLVKVVVKFGKQPSQGTVDLDTISSGVLQQEMQSMSRSSCYNIYHKVQQ